MSDEIQSETENDAALLRVEPSEKPMDAMQKIREILDDQNPHDPPEFDDLMRMVNQIDGVVSGLIPSKWGE